MAVQAAAAQAAVGMAAKVEMLVVAEFEAAKQAFVAQVAVGMAARVEMLVVAEFEAEMRAGRAAVGAVVELAVAQELKEEYSVAVQAVAAKLTAAGLAADENPMVEYFGVEWLVEMIVGDSAVFFYCFCRPPLP